MTLPLWLLVLLLAVPLACGVVVMRLLGIGRATDRLSHLGWCWLAGAFVIALVTFVWLLAGKPVDGRWLAPGLGAVALAGLLTTRRRPVLDAHEAADAPRWERVLFVATVAVIAVTILARLLALNVQPVLFGDEANIFAHKAKAMYSVPRLDLEYVFRQAWWDVKHIDYPLFDPMLHAWVYAGAGRITLVDNRWPVQMFAFALLLVLAGALRRRVRPGLAALLLIAFFGMQVLDKNIGPSRAELLLLVGFFTSVDAWLRWSEARRPEWWRLCWLAIACALWAKNEAALLLLSFGCAVALARMVRAVPALGPSRGRSWLWVTLPASIVVLHVSFNAWLGVRNDLFDPRSAGTGLGFWERAFGQLVERFWPVVEYYARELAFDASEFRLLVPVLLLAFLAAPRRTLGSAGAVPLAIVLIALAGYHVVFFATPYPLADHLPTAADRTMLHVVPVAVLGAGMALAAAVPVLGRAPARSAAGAR